MNTPVYRAQILPPDAEFPSNGLPVFHLTWRNDDGGPGYGADSRIDFVAPADGEYILHLKDVRGMGGPDFAYRLSIRETVPSYQLAASPENPNIPRGGNMPLTVSADRLQGYEGPIEIEVKGLPPGVTASAAKISAEKIRRWLCSRPRRTLLWTHRRLRCKSWAMRPSTAATSRGRPT